MKAHCLQHEPFEGMGAIEAWLREKKFDISHTRFFESDVLPSVTDPDWIIIMGGSMSVNDEQELPWLVREKQFIRECIAHNKVVIGVCLGAQLIANSLGARVYPNSDKEIGWFPVRKTPAQSPFFENWPEALTVYHWHGETFDLPSGSELLASSEACRNQIFTIPGKKVIGFQCHPETTSESLASLTDGCRNELITSTYVQSESDMLKNEKLFSLKMHEALFRVLDRLFETKM